MTPEQEALREKVARAIEQSLLTARLQPATKNPYALEADAAIAVVLKEAASRVREKMYMLNIGTPGEGPFTAQDRVCCETREQAADFILSLIPQEEGK